MPSKLSERPEELVRQYLSDHLTPSEMQGYNPQQTDPTASDFLPVTSNWSDWGDTYPKIVVTEREGPQIPNAGSTNTNSIQGDGSGSNQLATHNITVSCQALEGEDYQNGVDAEALVHDLYQEVKATGQNNAPVALASGVWMAVPTPPTWTENEDETDSGSTRTWVQGQGTVPVTVLDTP